MHQKCIKYFISSSFITFQEMCILGRFWECFLNRKYSNLKRSRQASTQLLEVIQTLQMFKHFPATAVCKIFSYRRTIIILKHFGRNITYFFSLHFSSALTINQKKRRKSYSQCPKMRKGIFVYYYSSKSI